MTSLTPYLSEFLTIAFVHLVAVASPGPDFAIIVRQSLLHGKRTAIWSSLGVGCGILIHVGYCLLGIGLIISRSVLIFSVLKYCGALYLIYIGSKALRARPIQGTVPEVSTAPAPTPSRWQAMRTGFLTNGLNPKATLFFLSLFTVVISPQTPLPIQALYGIYMAIATALWFSGLSLFFSHSRVRETFGRMGHRLEQLTGVILIWLGVKLAAAGLE